MLFVPDDVAVKQNRVGDYNLPVASQEIFVVVWIVVYVFKIRGRVVHEWAICGDLRYV